MNLIMDFAKKYSATIIFLSYALVFIIFYPYLLLNGVIPKFDLASTAVLLFLLIPLAMFTILFFPVLVFILNEYIREHVWKNGQFFFDTNDHSIFNKKINDSYVYEIEEAKKIHFKKFSYLNSVQYLIGLRYWVISSILLTLLMILSSLSEITYNLEYDLNINFLFLLLLELLFLIISCFLIKNCLLKKDKQESLKSYNKTFLGFTLRDGPFILIISLTITMQICVLVENILKKFWIEPATSLSMFIGLLLALFFHLVIFIPNNIREKSITKRFYYSFILSVGLYLFIILESGVVLALTSKSNEHDIKIGNLVSIPARVALQNFNLGDLERPIVINKEQCELYKNEIWNKSYICQPANCFIAYLIIDLGNKYVRLDNDFVLELKNDGTRLINNRNYKNVLEKDEKKICINYKN